MTARFHNGLCRCNLIKFSVADSHSTHARLTWLFFFSLCFLFSLFVSLCLSAFPRLQGNRSTNCSPRLIFNCAQSFWLFTHADPEKSSVSSPTQWPRRRATLLLGRTRATVGADLTLLYSLKNTYLVCPLLPRCFSQPRVELSTYCARIR